MANVCGYRRRQVSLVSVSSVNSDADAAASADDDDNDEILRQVTIRIRVHNFGAQNASSVQQFMAANRPDRWLSRKPFVEMKSAKRRRTTVAGIVSCIGRDSSRPTDRLGLPGFRHKSVGRRARVPDERTLPGD